MVPRFSTEITKIKILTRNKRKRCQGLDQVVCHNDILRSIHFDSSGKSNILSVLDHGVNVVGLQRVEDCEEVVSVGHAVFRHLVGEVYPELRIGLPLG